MTSGKNFHEETKKILNETLTKVNDLEHDKSTLEERNQTLTKTLDVHKSGSSTEKQNYESEVKKLEEELELANEALNQASETVQTLEDQMAKLYVEKEELKTRFFNLQQTSTDNEESQQVYIQELEAENESQKATIAAKINECEELVAKFDGLSILRDRENEIAANKETALTEKISEMMSRYEEFQQQIESCNARTVEYDADLEQFKEANEKLVEQLEEEREMVDEQQKQILKARESEAVHIERGQDLAKKLARVTTEMRKAQDNFAKEKLRLETVNVQLVDESKTKVDLLEQIMKQTQHVSDTLTRRCDDYENENMSLRKSLEEMAKRVVRTSLARSGGGGSNPATPGRTNEDGEAYDISAIPESEPGVESVNVSSAQSVVSTSTQDILKSTKKVSRNIDNVELNKNIANMKAEIEKITSSIMH
jgi:chromosome segregation ATPase